MPVFFGICHQTSQQARRPDSTHVFMQEESMTETMQCIWELLNASQMKDLLGLMNTQLTNYNSGSHCLGLYPAYYTSELNFYFDQQSKDNQCKCILSTHSVATADSCVRSPQPPPRFCRHALLAIVVSRALKKQVKSHKRNVHLYCAASRIRHLSTLCVTDGAGVQPMLHPSPHTRTLVCSHTAACNPSPPYSLSPSSTIHVNTLSSSYDSFTDPRRMESWVGPVRWPTAVICQT